MKPILYTLLIVSISIKASFQKHPRYSYVCKEDGSVEFTGFKLGSTITFTSTTCADTTPAPIVDRANEVVNITAECMGGTVEVLRNITVTVQDINLKENGKPVNSSAKIIGGLESHTFELQCNPITTVSRTVLRQFHLVNLENILPKENEIGQVDMRFKAEDNIDLPDISEVYIGDEFYMFLQYKGVSKYLLEPQKCTAYEGNDKSDTNKGNQVLWNIATKNSGNKECITSQAKSLGLVGSGGFIYLDTQTVRSRLNGFRFRSKVEDITILCNVLLKLPSTNMANKSVCSKDVYKRRKRSSRSRHTTSLDVMHTLSVKDRANQGSSFSSRSVAQVITTIASVFIITIL